MAAVPRHKAALRRSELSRPVRLAIEHRLLGAEATFFDYGCGHGDDVRLLNAQNIAADGWDPVLRPAVSPVESHVVNMGYVLNVIEEPAERRTALGDAWDLTTELLVVSARLIDERRDLGEAKRYADGWITSSGTFQRFYGQAELREYINETLGAHCVPAAPGVFFVFRDDANRQEFVARRFRTRGVPRLRKSDILFEEHREPLARLIEFFEDRGRLPRHEERMGFADVEEACGSVPKAFAVVRRVTGAERWAELAEERKRDLELYLALDRLCGLRRFLDFPTSIRHDVRAHFGTFRNAARAAQELLFAAGDVDNIDKACRHSPVGKLTGNALYVHVEALVELPRVLCAYEGCARWLAGEVDGANVVKLHRSVPRVSYLVYPRLYQEPHPGLAQSVVVYLDRLDLRSRRYQEDPAQPILHRKELLLRSNDEARTRFERLTRQEEQWGLYDDTTRIGTRGAWEGLLASKGLWYRGHRLVRRPTNCPQGRKKTGALD